MKWKPTLAAVAFFLLFTGTAFAQTAGEQQKWMDYMTPSAFHKIMSDWDGEWEEKIKTWTEPGAAALEMEAGCENRMLLDGRYQESRHEGSFSGMPFKGITITGYDNTRKLVVITSIDNFGTGILYLEGPWDESSKTATLKGKITDPVNGGTMEIRQVLKIIDDNTQKIEQFTTKDGKEFKTLEILLTRKKNTRKDNATP